MPISEIERQAAEKVLRTHDDAGTHGRSVDSQVTGEVHYESYYYS